MEHFRIAWKQDRIIFGKQEERIPVNIFVGQGNTTKMAKQSFHALFSLYPIMSTEPFQPILF